MMMMMMRFIFRQKWQMMILLCPAGCSWPGWHVWSSWSSRSSGKSSPHLQRSSTLKSGVIQSLLWVNLFIPTRTQTGETDVACKCCCLLFSGHSSRLTVTPWPTLFQNLNHLEIAFSLPPCVIYHNQTSGQPLPVCGCICVRSVLTKK